MRAALAITPVLLSLHVWQHHWYARGEGDVALGGVSSIHGGGIGIRPLCTLNYSYCCPPP